MYKVEYLIEILIITFLYNLELEIHITCITHKLFREEAGPCIVCKILYINKYCPF